MADTQSTKFGFGTDLPPDMQFDAAQIQRRRMVADMLMKQALTPYPTNQMAGRFVVPSGIGQGLTQIGHAMLGARLNDRAEQEYGNLAQRYNKGLAEEVQRYTTRRQGGEPVMAGEGMISPADPRGAAVSAIASSYGPMRQIGLQDLKDLGKHAADIGGMSLKDWAGLAGHGWEPSSIVQAMLSARAGYQFPEKFLRRKSEVHGYEGRFGEMVPGQYLGGPGTGPTMGGPGTMPTGGGGSSSLGQPGSWNVAPQYDQSQTTVQSPGGSTTVPYFTPQGGGKPVFPPTNITNVQNMPENAAATAWAKEQVGMIGGRIKESEKVAGEAVNDLGILKNAAEAYTAGIKTGSLQGPRNEVEKFLETANMKSPTPGVSNTDVFMKTMAGRILQHTKELRPMSDADANLLRDILAGRNMSDPALRRMLEIGIESGVKAIHRHNSLINQASGMAGSLPGLNLMRREIPEGTFPLSLGYQGDVPQTPVGKLSPAD